MARRRAFIRAVLGGAAALALALGGVTVAAAAEDPVVTGSIAGTVTSTVDGSALRGIVVQAQRDGGTTWFTIATNASGGYTIEGLGDGDYTVRFSDLGGDFVTEYWNDARDVLSAQRITVTNGSVHTGVDAALAPTHTASISGKVTREDDGTPVAGVSVTTDGPTEASVTTDSTGTYTLPNLAAGSYVVSFFPEGTDLKREYWKDASDYSQATPVVVGDGEAVSAIDASLVQGGSIQGVVTREDDGSAIAGAEVQALDSNNEIVAAATAGASGEYTLGGLPTGSYRVRFASTDPELLPEYWDGVYEWDYAKYVPVVEKETVAGIDASLVVAGYISGTVTRGADGQPLQAWVMLYDVNEGNDLPNNNTNIDGTYRVAVAPGTYKVRFLSPGLAEEYWEDAAIWETAKTITVAARQEVAGIDAALKPIAAISGTVTIDSTEASKIWVEAWSDGHAVRSIRADAATGAYTLDLPRGTYVVKARVEFANGTTTAKPQFFDGVATAAEATPVSLAPAQVRSGIDFALTVDKTPEPQPVVSLGVGSIRAGNDITISGTGFTPGATIGFELHSDPIALGTLTADADGALQGTLRIPVSAPAGAHTLVALSGTTVIASTALTVTAAAGAGTGGQAGGSAVALGGGLAATGADAPVALIAFAVVAAVMGGLLLRRRRVDS
jgi:hypothetical protein